MVSATPSASSWGAGGYGGVWVGPESAWTWRHVHHATRRVAKLARDHQHATGLVGRALDQAIRELLLLQSSDWNFILKTGTAMGYALARIRAHTARLGKLASMVERGRVDDTEAKWMDDVTQRDNFLSHLQGAALRGPFQI